MVWELMNELSNKRVYYLDILRVIACVSVIMIHTSGGYVDANFNGLDFYVGNIFDSLLRIVVQLFVMVSGA